MTSSAKGNPLGSDCSPSSVTPRAPTAREVFETMKECVYEAADSSEYYGGRGEERVTRIMADLEARLKLARPLDDLVWEGVWMCPSCHTPGSPVPGLPLVCGNCGHGSPPNEAQSEHRQPRSAEDVNDLPASLPNVGWGRP